MGYPYGPIWQGGNKEEDKTLASCYRKSFELAREYSIKSIAFPAISTGAYGFPSKRASEIAVKEINRFLQKTKPLKRFFLSALMYKHTWIFKKPLKRTLRLDPCQGIIYIRITIFWQLKLLRILVASLHNIGLYTICIASGHAFCFLFFALFSKTKMYPLVIKGVYKSNKE